MEPFAVDPGVAEGDVPEFVGGGTVDTDGTGVEALGDRHRAVGLRGEDSPAVLVALIDEVDCPRPVAERRNGTDRPELFVVDEVRVLRDVREQRRVEPATVSPVAADERRAAVDSVADESLDPLGLALVDERADPRFGVE